MSIKERNLLEGFIKNLSILLGHLPFQVISVLDFGLEQLLQLGHFCSIEVIVLFELLLKRSDLIFKLFLLGLPLFLPN